MSLASRTLKSKELPLLDKAREMALQLPYGAWINWMRSKHSYSQSVRMCTFLGVNMPSRKFYDAIKNYNRQVAA